MKTIQLKQCYRCRRLFHSKDPNERYCKECQRELRKRQFTQSTSTRDLLKYAAGFFAGLFVFNLGYPGTAYLGLAIIAYVGYLVWRRFS